MFRRFRKESGTLKSTGNRDLQSGEDELEENFHSGFKFKHFRIPYFQEAYELANVATNHIADPLIGWNVTLTPNGMWLWEVTKIPAFLLCGLLKMRILRE